MDTPLSVCETRDVKGLYKKAREGSIKGFTGVTQAYEAPQNPDLVVTTETNTITESARSIIELLQRDNVIPKNLIEEFNKVKYIFQDQIPKC